MDERGTHRYFKGILILLAIELMFLRNPISEGHIWNLSQKFQNPGFFWEFVKALSHYSCAKKPPSPHQKNNSFYSLTSLEPYCGMLLGKGVKFPKFPSCNDMTPFENWSHYNGSRDSPTTSAKKTCSHLLLYSLPKNPNLSTSLSYPTLSPNPHRWSLSRKKSLPFSNFDFSKFLNLSHTKQLIRLDSRHKERRRDGGHGLTKHGRQA